MDVNSARIDLETEGNRRLDLLAREVDLSTSEVVPTGVLFGCSTNTRMRQMGGARREETLQPGQRNELDRRRPLP